MTCTPGSLRCGKRSSSAGTILVTWQTAPAARSAPTTALPKRAGAAGDDDMRAVKRDHGMTLRDEGEPQDGAGCR